MRKKTLIYDDCQKVNDEKFKYFEAKRQFSANRWKEAVSNHKEVDLPTKIYVKASTKLNIAKKINLAHRIFSYSESNSNNKIVK